MVVPSSGKPASEAQHRTLPVFLKEGLSILVIGGGESALRAINHLMHNQHIAIKMVSITCLQEFKLPRYNQVTIIPKAYEQSDLDDCHLIIMTTKDPVLSGEIILDARKKKKPIHIPHAPNISNYDFGEIEWNNSEEKAFANRAHDRAHHFKKSIQGDLPVAAEGVNANVADNSVANYRYERFNNNVNGRADKFPFSELHWKRIASYSVLAFFFMILGHILLSYIPFKVLQVTVTEAVEQLDGTFLLMIVAGFTAQLIDGALGMGYGVTCTTFLLSLGINLPAISGSIHTAEMFSSAASGYSHYRFGNVNKKLFRALLIPGIIGAVAGAWLLSTLGTAYASFIRPALGVYTLFLGLKIFLNAFSKNKAIAKVKRVGWLAGAGGFLDSFGGGGWGPLVTSTLIAKGKTPKYVIGTVSVTEFFVTLASALTFFTLIGLSHWEVIAGLIIGGVLAAPLAARLAGRLPVKTMFIIVGLMVMIWSFRIIAKSFGLF